MTSLSYSTPAPARSDAPLHAWVAGEPMPRLRADRTLQLLLLLVVALQAFSWWQLEGYQLADSVEYMERARRHAAGQSLVGHGMVRSFGFSALLVPFFWLSDRLSLPDPRVVIHGVRLFQMLLGLGLVVSCAHIGARLAGRSAGLITAFVVGVNPIFLQYTISPVSGIAAALCVALAVLALLERDTQRGWLGGLALGAALLMAYQTVTVAVPLIALVAVRNRRGAGRATLALCAGYALGVLAQIGLDRFAYGEWGVTLANYLFENAGHRLAYWLFVLGFEDQARSVFERIIAPIQHEGAVPKGVNQPYYYALEIQRLLVAPIAALTAVGLILAAKRPRWSTSLLVLVLLFNAWVMSGKGAKSFRLWLPMIPLIAPLAGLGAAWILGPPGARAGRARSAALGLALAAGLVLGILTLREVNMRRYGAYWQAMEHVNAHVGSARAATSEQEPSNRPRVASAYHWAVFLRESPDVELIKLPQHLHRWSSLDTQARAEALAVLKDVDWLLLHLPILHLERTLFDSIAERFEVVAAYWSRETDPHMGPVLVLRRARTVPSDKPLVRALSDVDLSSWRHDHGLDRHLLEPLAFIEPAADSAQSARRLVYLGWRWRPLAGSDLGWLEHHWWTDTGLAGDWLVVDRITDPTGRNAWQNDHGLGYGFRPTSDLEPGTLLVEGYVLLAGEEPFTSRFGPLGGPYRRGDLIPASMWLKLARFDEEGRTLEQMPPAAGDGWTPIDLAAAEELDNDMLRAAGLLFSPDRLVRVGPFLLPVHPSFRWPDDGRPDPE